MKYSLTRSILAVLVLMCGAFSAAHAAVPEIDPSMGSTGLALLAGAALVIRGRKKR